ncbi:2-oxo acid dehydrogenase subunit E2, partial [Oleiphilus sp. HI0125]
ELPDFVKFGEVEIRKLEKLHALTAKNMQSSWNNVPHVTQFDEADITELETFRKSKKDAAAAKGLKLTPLPFMIKACAHALKDLPQFNVSLDMANNQIIQKHYYNIGIAVDTSYGLVVPVIKDVLHKDLWEIAAELGELAEKAKARKLSPADMQGACFTISSLGSVGGTAFTPIVNQPEVAILGVSKAQMKPIYSNGEFHPRLMLPLSLSYDHRAVNGADAARFSGVIAKYLSDIRELLL